MPRKGSNIYKRKDGRWEGRYIKARNPDGKAIYGDIYAKTYRDVKKKMGDVSHIKKTAEKGDIPGTDSERFRLTANKWFEFIQSHIKESSSNKYLNLMESYIFPALGERMFNEINKEILEALCKGLLQSGGKKGNGLSVKTVSDTLSVIREILEYGGNDNTAILSTARLIQIKHETKRLRVLSKGEQRKLCKYLYSELNGYNMGILVCLFTGLRIGEICALRWEDISLSEQTIHVRKTLQRVQDKSGTAHKTKIIITAPKSSSSIRVIPIPDELAKAIAAYQISQTGYFLTNSNYKYLEPRIMQYHFKDALKKSSIDSANYHALRHTFATRCIELGFDVKSLSEILGHASVNITMNRYVHPSLELKKDNMQLLSELFTVK